MSESDFDDEFDTGSGSEEESGSGGSDSGSEEDDDFVDSEAQESDRDFTESSSEEEDDDQMEQGFSNEEDRERYVVTHYFFRPFFLKWTNYGRTWCNNSPLSQWILDQLSRPLHFVNH